MTKLNLKLVDINYSLLYNYFVDAIMQRHVRAIAKTNILLVENRKGNYMSKNITANLAPFDPSAGLADKRIPITDVAKQISKRIGQKVSQVNDITVQTQLHFKWVPADKIFINYKRQRWPEPKHMKKLLEKWNIMCVTPLQCRYDPVEDRYYGADGQQHMTVWLVKYGLLTHVPCFYVESTDENIESIQLLALNTDNEPMAKYFIHQQKIMMGDKNAIALEKAVTSANCETSYKKRAPGCITHISHLQDAFETYHAGALTLALTKVRQFWPLDKIEMPTVLGLLKVREIMVDEGVWNDSVFNDVVFECSNWAETNKDLHLNINHSFKTTYPTNYKGMGVREKIASGIIDIYEQAKGKTLCTKPFTINVPKVPVKVDEEETEEA